MNDKIIYIISLICIANIIYVIGNAKRFKSMENTTKDLGKTLTSQDKILDIIGEVLIMQDEEISATKIPVKIINKSGFPLPKYETNGSAGFDIRAVLTTTEMLTSPNGAITLEPDSWFNFSTGLYVEIPEGYELQIRGRSGLAFKHGISIVHGVGTADSDYRGEIKICLINHSNEPFVVKNGDRIGQGIIAPIRQAEFEEVEELSDSDRGQGGFGSTGV